LWLAEKHHPVTIPKTRGKRRGNEASAKKLKKPTGWTTEMSEHQKTDEQKEGGPDGGSRLGEAKGKEKR